MASINKRNSELSGLSRKTVYLTNEAMEAVGRVATELGVTQTSLTDSALKYIATLPTEQILSILERFDYLSPTERKYIEQKQKGGK
jgi:hypothetical protein